MSLLTPSRLTHLSSISHLSNTWYFLAAIVLSVCNQPDEVRVLYEYVLGQQSSEAEKLLVTRQIREALLKGAALAGLPKAINSLTQLKNATPQELREKSPLRPPSKAQGESKAGAEFFDKVYGKISKRVEGQMAAAYPDLAVYALEHVYEPLLSYVGVLTPKETSLMVVACLVPQDVNPQLKGHLKGALNNGATVEEVMSVRELAMTISKWYGTSFNNIPAKL